jgi:cytochrome P450
MAAMEDTVRQTADRLLDNLVGLDEVDLLADFAVPLAVTVACTLIGLPASAHDQFCEWGRALIRGELHTAEAFDEVSAAMRDHFVPLIRSRRLEPGDDLVSTLAIARNENRVTDYELMSIVFQLFLAGHETAAHFLANAVLALLERPVERAMVATDPRKLDAAVEELLRLEGPVKVTLWRFATAPIDVGGVTIEPGEPVLALVAAANRDEAMAAEPDQFRLDRSTNQHLSFGYGIHHCLGAALGRIEARVGIGRLLARFPELSLARPAEELRWRVNILIRGVSALPVRMGAHDDTA